MFELIKFDIIGNSSGNLVSLEGQKNIPFEIKRVYYIWGASKNDIRGKHSHKNLEQIIICLSGECEFLLNNGSSTCTIKLNKPDEGLYLKSNIWREFYNFSKDCVLMILASNYYEEDDYIRNFSDFLKNSQTRNTVAG